MNFALYIAKRYLRSKSSNNAINFITIIAALGVVLGAASLFIVLAGFAGLKDFTLQFSNIVDPDLKAEAAVGKSFLLDDETIEKLNALETVTFYSKVIEERVFITSDNKSTLAVLKGVDSQFKKVNDMDPVIVQGSWFDQETNQTVIGWGISRNLSYGVLDYSRTADIYVPKPGTGQITSPNDAFNSIKTVNVGVFNINETLDDTYIYASIDLARHLLSYNPNQVSSIEFKLKEGADEATAKNTIQTLLGDDVVVKNRIQLNDKLYKMLNTENLAVYLIFTLVLIIALFNVIGSIIMMILDKKKTLNTLFNIGATIKDIRKIFFLQGAIMSVVGGLVGIFIGTLFVWNQLHGPEFLKIYITPSLPYPVTLHAENFFIVFVTISILGIIASKIATVRINKNLVEDY
ncbi:ABC transporter permease [Mariniflexile ostreae]|uniref:ABC transporter permease n=1 Tax=Mariniflexile ostreae TaxID=1520892 RepID=A0ABV5FBM2_9FLAO